MTSVRGYQFRSKGKGEPKKNPAPYRSLDDRTERLRESIRPGPKADAADLEQIGFAEMFQEYQAPQSTDVQD